VAIPILSHWSERVNDEPTLLRLARQGDREALSRLLTPQQPLLFRVCLSQRLEPTEAEDATQEALIRATIALAGGKFSGRASLRTWLIRIALNACQDVRRKQKDDREPGSVRSALNLEATTIERVGAQAALATLPPRQRAVFLLREVEEWSRAETAQALGITPRRVDYELAQAKKALEHWRKSWIQSE
jgi:RNA polymerase sigma-70 factor, ECF subfamily